MRAQRIGDALLRSGPSPLLSFLAPSLSSSTFASIPLRPQSYNGHLQSLAILRRLATKTSPLNASTAAARKHADEDFPQQPERQPLPKGSDRLDAVQALTASVMGSNKSKTKSRANSSKFTSPPYATANSTASRQTSADRFRKANEDDKRSGGYLAQSQGRIEASLNFGDRSDNNVLSIDNIIGRETDFKSSIAAVPPPVRLDAFIGRSEEVDPGKGMDLGRAFKKLELKCNYNNVRGDMQKQRFHERPGLKRKRLKSERWRKRFKEGFRAVVAKVKDMRNKGW
ncbi:hypothetical protein MMC11_006276 [Xylographa trunciseda]|nr:hypothetical protein [Xylographa trunciseda]